MKKFKLDLEKLNVQSFHPADGHARARGTVRGRESGPSDGFSCAGASCHCQTLDWESCYQTCGPVESCQLFC